MKSDNINMNEEQIDIIATKVLDKLIQWGNGPEWQGVQIANWLHTNVRQDAAAMAAKFVHDHYYDSAYLYADAGHIDHQYTYVIWTGDKDDMWVSCYDQYNSNCVFVLKPEKIISKYMSQDEPMDYTDFANGEVRSDRNYSSKKVQLTHANATKIIDILTSSITN